MQSEVLYSAVIVVLCIFLQVNIIHSGGPTQDICSYVTSNFQSTYTDTIAQILDQFTADNVTIYGISPNQPAGNYEVQIYSITEPWYDNNYNILVSAFEIAASLTGSDVSYIQQVAEGNEFNPTEPVGCLMELLINLQEEYRSYSQQIMAIGQMLVDSQFLVGSARPSITRRPRTIRE